jgi:hypothetical protein
VFVSINRQGPWCIRDFWTRNFFIVVGVTIRTQYKYMYKKMMLHLFLQLFVQTIGSTRGLQMLSNINSVRMLNSPLVLVGLTRATVFSIALGSQIGLRSVETGGEIFKKSEPLRSGVAVPRNWMCRHCAPPSHQSEQHDHAVWTRSAEIRICECVNPGLDSNTKVGGIVDVWEVAVVSDAMAGFGNPFLPFFRPAFSRKALVKPS